MLRNLPDNHLSVDLDNWQRIAERLDHEIAEKHRQVLSSSGEDRQALIEVLILRQQVKLELMSYLINYLEENHGVMESPFYQEVLGYVNRNISNSELCDLSTRGIVHVEDSSLTKVTRGVISVSVNLYGAFASYVASYFPDQDVITHAKRLDAAARREEMRDKYHLSNQPGIDVYDDSVDLGQVLYPVNGVNFSDLPQLLNRTSNNDEAKHAVELREIKQICEQLQNPSRFYSATAYQELRSVKDAIKGQKYDASDEDIRAVRKRVAKEHVRRINTHQAANKVTQKLSHELNGEKSELESFKKQWSRIRDYASVTPSALPRVLNHFEALGSYIRGYLASEVPELNISVAEKLQITAQLTEALLAVNYEVESVLDAIQAWVELDTARKKDRFSPVLAPKYHNLALNAYYRLHEITGADTQKLNESLIDKFDHQDRVVDADMINEFQECLQHKRMLEADYIDAQRPQTPEFLLLSATGFEELGLDESYHEFGHNSIVLDYNEDLTASLLPDPKVRVLSPDSELNHAVMDVLKENYVPVEQFTLFDAINLLNKDAQVEQVVEVKAELEIDDQYANLRELEEVMADIGRMIEEMEPVEGEPPAYDDIYQLEEALRQNGVVFEGNLTVIQTQTITDMLAHHQQELSDEMRDLIQLYLDITIEFADKIKDERHSAELATRFISKQIPAAVINAIKEIQAEVSQIRDAENANAMRKTLRVAYNMVITPDSDKAQQQLREHAESLRPIRKANRLVGFLYGLAGLALGAISVVTFSFCKQPKQPAIDEENQHLLEDDHPEPRQVSRGGFFTQKTREMFARSRREFTNTREANPISDKLERLIPKIRD